MQIQELASSAELRETMVERQIRTFDVTDAGVLARMKDVPREIFVDPAYASLAYSDASLAVSGDIRRELTPPLILARLLKEAHIRDGERVLVVAGASGYTAALVAGLAASVVSLEEDDKLTAQAQAHFAALGLANAKAVTGPLEKGAPTDGPFDLILVDGVSDGVYGVLLGQLFDGGRLVGFVADGQGARRGKATLFQRVGGNITARPLFDGSAGEIAAFAHPREFVF
jgi:protein-L-isoaspartate(D-aspartate) O-methyltransferase